MPHAFEERPPRVGPEDANSPLDGLRRTRQGSIEEERLLGQAAAAAKRFKKVENATAVIWKTLLIAEKTFRRLDAPELLADVASGVVYVNGVRAVNQRERKAAP